MTSTAGRRFSTYGVCRRAASTLLASAVALLPGLLASRSAHAQSLSVLYSFTGKSDGANPNGLIRDSAGNLYGTTTIGGDLSCIPSFPGCGTVFKIDSSGKMTVLHTFTGPDGATPKAGLVRDTAGNLYGTTTSGGAFGNGTVFKVDTFGVETVVYSFCTLTNCTDGAQPLAGLILDSAHNLYGTTWAGGAFRAGTVFKLDASGKETVLHSFSGPDGQSPEGSLIFDSAGSLYGTTPSGGASRKGTVFKLQKIGTETVLYSFTGRTDGGFPSSALILDAAGNLYGTTGAGGDLALNRGHGAGTVFKLDPTGKETVLHAFTWSDGAIPEAGLVLDANGNLYGTTLRGPAEGNVFKVDDTGKETSLWNFSGKADGGYPDAGLVRANGNLYGTASDGGTGYFGTVFKIVP